MNKITIPKAGFDFLRKLKKNNNRDWFTNNKPIYEAELREPLKHIILELDKRIGKKVGDIAFDPKKSIFRINRDTRFSDNKDPYKTNLGAVFMSRTHKQKTDFPALYLHIEPDNCFIGGGLYMPTGEQMAKIRNAIIRNPKEFKKIISSPTVKKYFGGLTGERLKKAPRGMEPTHPEIDLLKWKQFIYLKQFNESDFQKKNVAQLIEKEFLAMLPLINWLRKAITGV